VPPGGGGIVIIIIIIQVYDFGRIVHIFLFNKNNKNSSTE
jgi:hypothetical protein